MGQAKKTTSIFCREFKRTFNANKYMDMTARVETANLHLNFYSLQDARFGRFVFTAALVSIGLVSYLDPGYIHETIGHLKATPQYDKIDNYVSGEERTLNQQLIHRKHNEDKLDHFTHTFHAYE